MILNVEEKHLVCEWHVFKMLCIKNASCIFSPHSTAIHLAFFVPLRCLKLFFCINMCLMNMLDCYACRLCRLFYSSALQLCIISSYCGPSCDFLFVWSSPYACHWESKRKLHRLKVISDDWHHISYWYFGADVWLVS